MTVINKHLLSGHTLLTSPELLVQPFTVSIESIHWISVSFFPYIQKCLNTWLVPVELRRLFAGHVLLQTGMPKGRRKGA